MIQFQAIVSEIEDFPAARLRRVVVSAPAGQHLPAYHAGQYAMLTFGGYSPRAYSIGNAPGRNKLEFHIRQSGSGATTFATTALQVGDSIAIAAPFGTCLYVPDCERPLLAVAGGSGLAGMKAIIEEALADTARRTPTHLYVGARTLQDLYLDDIFRTLEEKDPRFHYIPVLSEDIQPGIRQGFVTTALSEDFPDMSVARIYGAGPVEMLRHLYDTALTHGALPDHIHTDLDQLTNTSVPSEPDNAR
jgi:NAD(P)H-flavin reductase